jgi:uncharacterized damage-inducible protein DinB
MKLHLSLACSHILSQLATLVEQIHEDDFSRPVESLSQSTIGQHLRHTLEFFICFQDGYERGLINYDKRAHDKLIERDKFIALAAINRISDFIHQIDERTLSLEVGYDLDRETFITIETNATRELVYNIEHAVHHMAIMKIGVREISSYISLPKDFGIAASTVRYKETASSDAH